MFVYISDKKSLFLFAFSYVLLRLFISLLNQTRFGYLNAAKSKTTINMHGMRERQKLQSFLMKLCAALNYDKIKSPASHLISRRENVFCLICISKRIWFLSIGSLFSGPPFLKDWITKRVLRGSARLTPQETTFNYCVKKAFLNVMNYLVSNYTQFWALDRILS